MGKAGDWWQSAMCWHGFLGTKMWQVSTDAPQRVSFIPPPAQICFHANQHDSPPLVQTKIRINSTDVSAIASLETDPRPVLSPAPSVQPPCRLRAVTEVRRDNWRSLCPATCSKQGELKEVSQDLVWSGVEYLQERILHNLPGQLVPGLRGFLKATSVCCAIRSSLAALKSQDTSSTGSL